MRQIGILESESQAERFTAYLIAEGISALAEEEEEGWAVWVRDEDQTKQAGEELKNFRSQPDADRYAKAIQKAAAKLKEESRKREKARKNTVQMREHWGAPGENRNKTFTLLLIAICAITSLATNFGKSASGSLGDTIMSQFVFVSRADLRATQDELTAPNGDPLASIKKGQVWRLVTPIFLHGSVFHLLFNMYWLWSLGPPIESKRGTPRFALLVLAIAVFQNLLPAFLPESFQATVSGIGFSGVVYGLLGYSWMKSRFEPARGIFVSPELLVFMLAWLVLGFTGILTRLFGINIDNWAHLLGLIAGIAIGIAPQIFRQGRK